MKNLLSSIIILMFSVNSFAVTEHIEKINSYIAEPAGAPYLNLQDETYVKFTGKDIKKGDSSKYVEELQKRFGLNPTGIYDDQLFSLVSKEQESGNLTPSGIIDSNTWLKSYGLNKSEAINLAQKSIENYNLILQKSSNISSDKFIVVNIPSQRLFLYDKSSGKPELLMTSKVIVGRKSTQTPIEDFNVISLKYSPTWTPTSNMLKRNVYKGKNINVGWLKSHHLKVIDENGVEYDYENISEAKNPKFIQELGEFNALGNLKFETSSNQDIYLHDTNERHLFSKNIRTYSSGCIRVQDYKDLASSISGKSLDHINKQISKRETFHESIKQKIPVYVDYSQLVVENGKLLAYPDVYNKNPVSNQ